MLGMMDGIKGWRVLMMFSWAGWVNREQLKVIDYLKDENQTLRRLIKKQRIRLSLEDRHRLGVKGRAIGRKKLEEVATIARLLFGQCRGCEVQAHSYLKWNNARSDGHQCLEASLLEMVVRS